MNTSSKTNQQLLLEIEELRTRLAVAQQHLQEANERLQAGMTERKGTEQVLEERLRFEILLAEISARFVNLLAAQDKTVDRVPLSLFPGQGCGVSSPAWVSLNVPVRWKGHFTESGCTGHPGRVCHHRGLKDVEKGRVRAKVCPTREGVSGIA